MRLTGFESPAQLAYKVNLSREKRMQLLVYAKNVSYIGQPNSIAGSLRKILLKSLLINYDDIIKIYNHNQHYRGANCQQ